MKTERFDKKLFKQEVLNNLKTQFRVEIDNASQQQIAAQEPQEDSQQSADSDDSQ